MNDYPKIEMLSSEERDLLIKEMGTSQMAFDYGKFILPVILVLAFLSWYYDWFNIFKFLTTVLAIAALFSVVAAFFQIRYFRQDLKENRKKTIRFELLEKFAEGYVNSSISMKHNDKVRTRIVVYDAEIRAAVAYKKANQQNTFFNQSDTYDKLLRYDYYFKVKTLDNGKTEKITVPVEYYPVGKEGSTVTITMGVHSKKIFKIEDQTQKNN